MRFEVVREKWLRGEEDSYLLRGKDDKMCCLGFRAMAAGYLRRDLWGLGTLDMLLDADVKVPQFVAPRPTEIGNTYRDTRLCTNIIEVNDQEDLVDSAREAELTRLFAALGDEVVFV